MSTTIDVETVPKAESTAVVVRPPESVSLFRTDDPQEVVKRATGVATALRDVIQKQGLISEISGKKYPKCEAWTLCGTMLGIFPVLCWSRPVEHGWEARVEARTRNGEIVGAAEAECLKTERNWSNRDDFAVRSMAQTRATAKALRMPLGFIMTLAGYEATPSEEMLHENGAGEDHRNKKPTQASPATSKLPGSTSPAPGTEVKNTHPVATQQQKDRMLRDLIAAIGDQKRIHEFAVKADILFPTSTLLDWPLRYVPVTKHQYDLLLAAIKDFFEGDEAKKPFINAEPPVNQKPAEPKQQELKPAASGSKWRDVVVHFGKNKGRKLGDLDPNSLGWYCRNFVVELEYEKDGKRYKKSESSLRDDRALRAALDEATKEVESQKECQ